MLNLILWDDGLLLVRVFCVLRFPTESHRTTGVCKYWACVWEYWRYISLHKHPLSTYYVLGFWQGARQMLSLPSWTIEAASSWRLSSPYSMPGTVKIFTSLTYVIIIKCFLGILVSILEMRRLRQNEVRKPSPRVTKVLSGGNRI